MIAKLTHICLFSDRVTRLANFYGAILEGTPTMYGEAYAEVDAGGVVLSVFSIAEQNELAPGSAKADMNCRTILEFHVEDVDAQYERLKQFDVEWVKPPSTQIWGNRSIYFRDIDGNLVNFYSRVNEG